MILSEIGLDRSHQPRGRGGFPEGKAESIAKGNKRACPPDWQACFTSTVSWCQRAAPPKAMKALLTAARQTADAAGNLKHSLEFARRLDELTASVR